jgi:hypothetical protein
MMRLFCCLYVLLTALYLFLLSYTLVFSVVFVTEERYRIMTLTNGRPWPLLFS